MQAKKATFTIFSIAFYPCLSYNTMFDMHRERLMGSGPDTSNTQPTEQSPFKERPDPLFDVINICGKAGAGTSTLVKGLQKRFQEQGYDVEVIVRGRFLRDESIKTTGKDFTGYYHRETAKDVDIDTATASTLMSPRNKGKIIIIDSRLSGWIAKKLSDAGTQMYARHTNILLTARADVRYHRVYTRKIEEAQEKGEREVMEYRAIVHDTHRRDDKDKGQFGRTYPELAEIDVLSPRNRDEKGEPIYHRVINSTNMGKDQVVDAAEAIVKARGLVSQPRKAVQRFN